VTQALNALVFLYHKALGRPLGELKNIPRAASKKISAGGINGIGGKQIN
jgi:hypothetical protein